MDLAEPYRAVSPSLDGAVLEVLSRSTGPLTGRGLAALLHGKGSHEGVRRVLQRLTAHGLVGFDVAGPSALYTLNHDHVAAPALALLMGLRGETVRRIREAVGGWKRPPRHCSLFGSMARGEGDVHSDIDILVVRPPGVSEANPDWRVQLDSLATSVHRWTGNHAALMDVSARELRDLQQRSPYFIEEVRRDSLFVAGESFDNVLPPRRLRGRPR